MINHDNTENGKHYWAIHPSFGILVILKTRGRYQVCGAWESGIRKEEIEIIKEIEKPEGYEESHLYYG